MKKRLILALTGAVCVLVCAFALAGCPTPENDVEEGTYRVAIADVNYGTITAEPRGGDEGTEITLTLTPDSGYRLKGGSLKYRVGEETPVIINSVTGKFKLPAANVTVNAEFEEYFRVTIPESLAAYIEAVPSGGPSGTVITLTISSPSVDEFVAADSLKYNDGYDDVLINVGTKQFELPPSDVTVYALFDTMDTLIRKMIPVAGGRVISFIGTTSATYGPTPFYNAGPDTPVIVEPYSIGATEVSYQLWYTVKSWATDAARGANVYTFPANTGDTVGTNYGEPTEAGKYFPVAYLTWWDAVVWCNAYSEWAAEHDPDKVGYQAIYKTRDGAVIRTSVGKNGTISTFNMVLSTDEPGFRLPTNKEWEFAARGGRPRAAAWQYLYAGSDDLDAVGWYTANSSISTHTVASKAPNTLGIYDMSGNVWEFVEDRYGTSSYQSFYLGGTFQDDAASCSVTASRMQNSSLTNKTTHGGFRVAGPYQF